MVQKKKKKMERNMQGKLVIQSNEIMDIHAKGICARKGKKYAMRLYKF